jgi:endonuclease YncB( thermonuclease family)
VKLRRPRRIFRSTLPRPARGTPRLGLRARPLRAGPLLIWFGAIALGFLGLGALVTANTLFPNGFPAGPQDSMSARSAPADRVAAAASDIAVVDGSTLRLAQHVVRLLGIETPGRGQTCQSAAPAFDCGAASTAALAALVHARPVTCDIRDSDSMGRPLAICTADGAELNRALVAGGWARVGGAANLASAKAEELRNAENLARTEHRGLWARNAGGSANGSDAAW